MQSLASRVSWRSLGACRLIPSEEVLPDTLYGAERSSLRDGMRGRRPTLLAHLFFDGIAALSHIAVRVIVMYSNQTISKRLKELDITQKIASVEAYQAQREDVQQLVYAFWNHAPPLGICGIPRRMLIDVDEFGVTIERCNRKKGWALKVFRVLKDGHYGHGQKITVLFAIEPGDPNLPPHVYGSIQWP